MRSPKKISVGGSNKRYAVRISSSTKSGAGPLSQVFLVQTLKGGKFTTRLSTIVSKLGRGGGWLFLWHKKIFTLDLYANLSSSDTTGVSFLEVM